MGQRGGGGQEKLLQPLSSSKPRKESSFSSLPHLLPQPITSHGTITLKMFSGYAHADTRAPGMCVHPPMCVRARRLLLPAPPPPGENEEPVKSEPSRTAGENEKEGRRFGKPPGVFSNG